MSGSITSPSVLVIEPAGDRQLDLPLTIGGPGMRVVVPDMAVGEFARIESRSGELRVIAAGTSRLMLNAQPVPNGGERAMRAGDVLAIATTRLLLRQPAGGSSALEVRHLAGNDTLAPLVAAIATAQDADSSDAEIVALDFDGSHEHVAAARPEANTALLMRRQSLWLWCAVLLALLFVAGLAVLSRLQSVQLKLSPADTRVRADGLIYWQSGSSISVWPGRRRLSATRSGYQSLTRTIDVGAQVANPVEMNLQKLPGILDIDTAGVAAIILIDGAEAGRAPGRLTVPAGRHTMLLRADRYLDAIVAVDVLGMQQRQRIALRLAPSWGRLTVNSMNAGAMLSVNDAAPVALPTSVELPAGVHRLRIAAPGAHDWMSSVLVKPGETTGVGPIVLGAPDAQLSVRSEPAGANISVAGLWRGRAPLRLALPAGARYEVLVAQTGYQSATRVVDAIAGNQLTVDARLTPILVRLSVSGQPADAEIVVDGQPRGRSPASLQLLAGDHHVEVHAPGMQLWSGDVTLAAGAARVLEYRLIPLGRPAGWTAPAATLTAKGGPALALINGGVFTMGSARREQGRRPNEGQVRVTLSRPFYLGIHEVTNAQFHRFKSEHNSGIVDQHSVDLDSQAVTNVTWEQAVEYCNWLSAQEGLPAAYESKDGSWQLHRPANNGYRLPTAAEWEFAARMSSGAPRRYEWGDDLPVPAGVGNIAGVEVAKLVDPVLPGYRDEYVSVAPVGKFPPNGFGLYDMTGNVSEWTNDAYLSYVDSTPVTDPLGPASTGRHTVRGSSWRSASISELRLSWREGATEPSQDLGFRVARYAE